MAIIKSVTDITLIGQQPNIPFTNLCDTILGFAFLFYLPIPEVLN